MSKPNEAEWCEHIKVMIWKVSRNRYGQSYAYKNSVGIPYGGRWIHGNTKTCQICGKARPAGRKEG